VDSCAGAAEGWADAVAYIGYVQNGGVVAMNNGVAVVVVKGCTITNAKEVRDSEGGFVRGRARSKGSGRCLTGSVYGIRHL
jgi:hypothetical protein